MPKVLADLQAFADALRKEIVDLKNDGANAGSRSVIAKCALLQEVEDLMEERRSAG
jgi:hypothetical protein